MVFVNIVFLRKIRLGSASWVDLESILTPKGVPKGSQMGPQTGPTFLKKSDRFLDRFWSALGLKKGRVPWDSAPTTLRAGAVEGVRGGITPSPRGLGLGFDLDLWIWDGSTCPEASLRSVPRRIFAKTFIAHTS